VVDDDAQEFLTTGEFARQARLTPKALRIYDRVGLLRPVATDRTNGYRRYSHAQVRTGQLIGVLRGAGLSLAEIGPVLDDTAGGTDAAIQRLDSLLADLDRRHADRRLLIRHVQATLREGTDPMFPIDTRRVLGRRVMSIQRRLHAAETDGFVREAKDAFRQHLDGAEPTGPFTLIFHGLVSDDSDGPLEAALGCPDNIQPSEIVGIRTEPGHDEAYTTITKAQWAYPAILAAYDAVACSPQVKARPGSRLSCREVYRAEPDAIGADDLVCDIAFPLGRE
jgi:DNA-binding transcriptional MerR regulator